MISEKDVVSGFHSFWSQLFPFMTPEFINAFNGTYARPILDESRRPLLELSIRKEVRYHDVVAETAFHLVRVACQAEVAVVDAISRDDFRQQAVNYTYAVLGRAHNNHEDHFILSSVEWDEVASLTRRYSLFLGYEKEITSNFEFEPKFPGLGFLSACRGDLAAGRILYEVKTVARGVHSKDLRQLFLYLALQAATGLRRWDIGGFINPRKGLVYRFRIEELLEQVSGGKTGIEVFGDIADFLGSRDIELDRSF